MSVADNTGDLIAGAIGDWEIVIGLETHAQITSSAKLFSGACTDFGAEPNTQVSLVDAAMPGMLPVINQYCVEQAIRTGLGLRAQINLYSVFDRKNYFYPDQPQGYQISQYKNPIVGEGQISLDMPDGQSIVVGIERLHLEQDAGKSLHDQDPDLSFVDLNRAGVALMEIVSRPDMRSATQAQTYMRKLRTVLRYLGSCDGNMEQGSLRADVNVSVRRPGEALGTRCEIKNINSIRFIGQAIEYESRRQISVLEEGGEIVQETRLFDARLGETRPMRTKEEAHDYRYFPDPDLLPLRLDQAWVDDIASNLPELPDDKKERLIADYGLSAYDAGVLITGRALADYYETVAQGRDAKLVANWVTGELSAALNHLNLTIEATPVTADGLGELLDLIADETISGRIAKDIFEKMLESGNSAQKIVDEYGLRQVTDMSVIEAIVDEVIASNPDKVAQVQNKPQMLGWFVGQVMKSSKGKANPQSVNGLLRQKLNISEPSEDA
ncbi:MAG: Asp-tRNA(Asn)/Glu-tRNA(Gln) amidotransferase subunit GatB [Parvularculales bacterium]